MASTRTSTAERCLSTTSNGPNAKKNKRRSGNASQKILDTARKVEHAKGKKKGQQTNTSTSNTDESTTPSKIYSQFAKPGSKKKKKKNRRDSFVIPGSPVTTPFYFNHSNNSSSSSTTTTASSRAPFRRTLPTVDASALFEQRRRHAKTLVQVLQDQVLRTRHRKSYILTGHNVPPVLLQHCLNMADSLLTREEQAAECSFNNFHGDSVFEWYVHVDNSDVIRVRCSVLRAANTSLIV